MKVTSLNFRSYNNVLSKELSTKRVLVGYELVRSAANGNNTVATDNRIE